MEGVVGWAMTDGPCQLPCYVGQRVSDPVHCFSGREVHRVHPQLGVGPRYQLLTTDEDKCDPKTGQEATVEDL